MEAKLLMGYDGVSQESCFVIQLGDDTLELFKISDTISLLESVLVRIQWLCSQGSQRQGGGWECQLTPEVITVLNQLNFVINLKVVSTQALGVTEGEMPPAESIDYLPEPVYMETK